MNKQGRLECRITLIPIRTIIAYIAGVFDGGYWTKEESGGFSTAEDWAELGITSNSRGVIIALHKSSWRYSMRILQCKKKGSFVFFVLS